MSTHIKTIYVNSEQQWITSNKYLALPMVPKIFVGDNVLFRFNVADNSHTAIDLTGYDFTLGINPDFTDTATDVARASTADFNNVLDWNQVSLSAGKICCRLDCSLSAMDSFMVATENKTAYATLWATKSGEVPSLLTQFKLQINNTVK